MAARTCDEGVDRVRSVEIGVRARDWNGVVAEEVGLEKVGFSILLRWRSLHFNPHLPATIGHAGSRSLPRDPDLIQVVEEGATQC